VEGELASLKSEHATTSQELVATQHALEVLQDKHKEVTGGSHLCQSTLGMYLVTARHAQLMALHVL
jgi:hypothetical protein